MNRTRQNKTQQPTPTSSKKFYPNPYLSPVTISRRSDVILYTELPSRCPSCDKKFSEVNFRRRFKRKILWSTFSYMLLVSIAGYVLLRCFYPQSFFAYLLLHRYSCFGKRNDVAQNGENVVSGCNWKKSYVVAGTGTKTEMTIRCTPSRRRRVFDVWCRGQRVDVWSVWQQEAL